MNQQERLTVNNQLLDEYERKYGIPPSVPPGTEEELQELADYLEIAYKKWLTEKRKVKCGEMP